MIHCRSTRVLEMQNFTPVYMKGWTYVRTYSLQTIFSEPKFLGCIVYQIFLPMIICCTRFARKSSALNNWNILVSPSAKTLFWIVIRARKHFLVLFIYSSMVTCTLTCTCDLRPAFCTPSTTPSYTYFIGDKRKIKPKEIPSLSIPTHYLYIPSNLKS